MSFLFRLTALMLVLAIAQACHVVVQDEHGNRLGDLDSLNWDSLLALPDSGDWNYPDSLAKRECKYFTVETYPTTTLYTWVELYADGTRKTRMSFDSSSYPGARPVSYPDIASTTTFTTPQPYSVQKSVYLCPTDTLYWLADPQNVIRNMGPGSDTVFFNYGAHARDSLVEPTISFRDTTELRSAVASVGSNGAYIAQSLQLMHFRGDSLRISLLAPTWISLLESDPGNVTVKSVCGTTNITVPFNMTSKGFPAILIAPTADVMTDSTVWQIRIRNRFGYRVNLPITTHVKPIACITIQP